MTKEMNCCTGEPEAVQSDGVPTTPQRLRSWILSPQGLAVTGIAATVVGLTLSWSWVVALGMAPLVLALGPCLLLCALGLCMNIRNHADKPSVKPNSVAEAGLRSATSSVARSPHN
jgi:hypothetical protein